MHDIKRKQYHIILKNQRFNISDPNIDHGHHSSREIRSPNSKPMDPSKLSMVCCYANQFRFKVFVQI